MKNTGFIVAVAAIALIGGFVIMNQNKEANKVEQPSVQGAAGASTSTDTSQAVSELNPVVSDDSSVKTIEVEMGSFYYKPSVMTVKKGEKVKLVLKSVSMMHDFNVDELGVKSEIVKDGDTGMVEFTPDKAGTFEYYCSVGQHRANGQVGTLTVTE